MGWWSTDILGGDTPLDFLYEIGQMVDSEDLYTERDIDGVKEKLEGLIPCIDKGTVFEEDEYEFYIGYQVLAVKMLEYGVKLPEKTKKALIHYINEDEWAKEDEERKETIENLISAIKNHDGEKLEIRSRGLFEVMGVKLSK